MSEDQRTEARIEVRLEVCLVENDQQRPLHTRDLSNSGVFIETGGEFQLEKGTIVHIRVAQPFADGESPPLVKAEVIRIDKNGMGLKFIQD